MSDIVKKDVSDLMEVHRSVNGLATMTPDKI